MLKSISVLEAILFFLLITAIFTVSSCATPYQAEGVSGGFNQLQLNDNSYQVSFRGNELTSEQRVHDLLLYRCAELTQQHGYKFFVIVNQYSRDDRDIRRSPTTISSFHGDTTVQPGSVQVDHSYTKTMVIRMMNSMSNSVMTYNAKIILSSLNVEKNFDPLSVGLNKVLQDQFSS